MSLQSRHIAIVGTCLAALALDQSTKWIMVSLVMQPPRVIWVTPFLNLTLGFNPGISFGLFGDTIGAVPVLASVLKLVISGCLLAWALTTGVASEAFGLALMAGGALGNAADRARQGAVTDFIDLHWADWHFPAFNLADAALTLGVIVMLSGALRAIGGQTSKKASANTQE